MTPSFNLLNEHWIPCIRLNGQRELLGLRDALVQAHDIREIYSVSPLTVAALHRLLLAITHRVFGPKDREVWATLWSEGKWDEKKLDSYFQEGESRLYLFDDEQPFYQVARFASDKEPKVSPLAQMSLELASGNNTMLFDHNSDETSQSITPAEAARRLVTMQSFLIAFGQSPKVGGRRMDFTDAPCARGALFLVQGDNLFQTLMLSMRQYPDRRSRLPDNSKDDKPAWEMDDPFKPRRDRPLGYLDYLTWQSLQIKLIRDDTGDVVGVQRIQGLGMDKDAVLDPLKSYRADKKTGEPIVRGFNPERVLWRDSAALFQVAENSRDAPENFKLLSDLVRHKVLRREQQFRYAAVGLATMEGQARNVVLWRYERMPLPLAYLDDPATVERLRNALQLAEGAHWRLADAREWLAWVWLKPDAYERFDEWKQSRDYAKRNDNPTFTALVKRLPVSQHFWWRLDQPFAEIMPRLVQDSAQAEQAILKWREVLKQTARTALSEITDGIEESPRMLRAIAKAQEQLEFGLGWALKIQEGGQA
jgi:CRISPR system Cascade subunit CasA